MRRVLVNRRYPLLCVQEAFLVSEVKRYDDAVCVFVKLVGHCNEPLLASRVPKLYVNFVSLDRLLNLNKIKSNCALVVHIYLAFIEFLQD